LKHPLATACDALKIPYGTRATKGIIFHDLRRTFKTNMARAGIDKAIRDTILGHNLPGMDDHYIKLNKNALHDAMGKFTEWLDGRLTQAKIQLKTGNNNFRG